MANWYCIYGVTAVATRANYAIIFCFQYIEGVISLTLDVSNKNVNTLFGFLGFRFAFYVIHQ